MTRRRAGGAKGRGHDGSMPVRVRLEGKKGWRKPAGAVVARPSRWGNPFRIGTDGDRAQCVARFREAFLSGRLAFGADDVRRELAGRDLACWCPSDGPCHADAAGGGQRVRRRERIADGTMGRVNLADVSSELYGLDPGAFTAARNARAKEAAAAGTKELAAEIRKLAKPTAAAWLANRLTRSRASAIDELISLGPELRRAQGGGQRAEMRRLGEKRRTLIADLVRSASASAKEGGRAIGSSVERQLEETLEAAVADDDLASVLRERTVVGTVALCRFRRGARLLARGPEKRRPRRGSGSRRRSSSRGQRREKRQGAERGQSRNRDEDRREAGDGRCPGGGGGRTAGGGRGGGGHRSVGRGRPGPGWRRPTSGWPERRN